MNGFEDSDEAEGKGKRLLYAQRIRGNPRGKKDLEAYAALATNIDKNAKGEHLLAALEKGFDNLRKRGAPEKAIIFTESTRTQLYIQDHLEKIPQFQGKIVLFNGSNTDKLSNQIYRDWMQANKGTDRITGSPASDKRAALVEHFQHPDTKIMIATEAGAEGINLQFCSFIVNYDLPCKPPARGTTHWALSPLRSKTRRRRAEFYQSKKRSRCKGL